MAQNVRDVMTADPLLLQKDATVTEAAMAMKGQDIGDVLVMDGERLFGIVTDRDITVRCVAESKDPQATRLGAIASTDLTTCEADHEVHQAVEAVSEKAIRRLPVIENGKPVGILSLGDLAEDRDPESALADVSAAPANT